MHENMRVSLDEAEDYGFVNSNIQRENGDYMEEADGRVERVFVNPNTRVDPSVYNGKFDVVQDPRYHDSPIGRYPEGSFVTWSPSEEDEFDITSDSEKAIQAIIGEEEDPLEPEIRTDGGTTRMAGPMGPGTKGPEEDVYMTDGGGYSVPGPMGGYTRDTEETIGDIEHVHPDYEDGAPM